MYSYQHRLVELDLTPEVIRIAYYDYLPATQQRGIILLIHGFPQSSYQFRHTISAFVTDGYRCLVPDYRGAGYSSKPSNDFRKSTMARDLIALLDKIGVDEKVHVVGHDIGGMIAYAMASRYHDRVKSVCWGECPLPGTKTYYEDRSKHAVQQFHFIFHSVPNLPEALVEGKERLYIEHFLFKITHNLEAFKPEDVDHYVSLYQQPGAMRCAFEVYRAFDTDAAENLAFIREHGKCRVPTLILSGAVSRHRHEAEEMALEVTDAGCVRTELIDNASHYLAEENPDGFARAVLSFVDQHR